MVMKEVGRWGDGGDDARAGIVGAVDSRGVEYRVRG